MKYYAHSGVADDRSDWQSLAEHLEAVAALAGEMARPMGLERAACLAGLLHDLGKYAVAFQQRLGGADIAVDHSTAGAALLLGDLAKGRDRSIAELIAYCIAGHHAGLPDRLNESGACLDRRIEAERPALEPDWQTELRLDARDLAPEQIVANLSKEPRQRAFQLSVMTRMIFSCLVDADYKDTERFYTALEGRRADREWPALAQLLPGLRRAFDAHMSVTSSAATELNRLRADILRHVRASATQAPGLFTLTVPTGGGKTLASLGFALEHAALHGHSRIIYAIPFTSIVDQTADIFRGILGDANVLEHHSAIDEDDPDRQRTREGRDKLKLAMEDWAAPVIVATNVQLFESLFAARPTRARKLHNIAGSVIILDEAQTIPRHLLKPCMRMLEELALNYGCSIVLCTATQPALAKPRMPDGLPLQGRELAPDPAGLAQQLRRARIVHAGPMDNSALIAALQPEPHALVIVNSRKHALDLYREAVAEGLDGLVHLTTRQHAAHRRSILADVRNRLREGRPCRVIATSLIEAGVDVDFPRVWRAEAGLDSVVQAAGRCNREGRRPRDESLVTVFSTPDYGAPAEVAGLVGDMKRMLDRHNDLLSLAAIEDYFTEVYWRLGDRLDGREKKKAILPRFSISNRDTDFAFRSVADDFRMVESVMVPVVVRSDDASEKAVQELGVAAISSGSLAKRLQVYCVQVPEKARDLLIRNGHVEFFSPALRGDQFAVLQTRSLYREDVGLLWEDADYLGLDSMIL